MTIPNEFLVWYLNAPVVCIGVDLEFSTNQQISGSIQDIDESYSAEIRRRVSIF